MVYHGPMATNMASLLALIIQKQERPIKQSIDPNLTKLHILKGCRTIDATVPFKSIHQVTWHRIQCVGISEARNVDYLRWLQNSCKFPWFLSHPDASKTSYIQMPLKGTNAVAICAQGVDEESQVHDLPGASDRIQYASKRGWGHDHISFLLVELKGLLDSRAVHTVVVPGWIRCFCTSSKSVANWASKVHQSLKFCVQWHVNIPCTSNVAKNDVCIGEFVFIQMCKEKPQVYPCDRKGRNNMCTGGNLWVPLIGILE